jgi:ATP/maltotriose-dependent transcriptional regulator MalT
MPLRFQQKLIIPAASRPLIERQELLEQLDRAIVGKRVVAVAAPAGWGKTTALTQWAARSRLPAAWYTLDAADRDPHLFLDYLLHSAAAFVPDASAILARLAGTSPHGMAELTQAVALGFAAAPQPFALVLDDFHALDEDPPRQIPGAALALDLLASIAEYAVNCHLVIASRTLPALHGLVRMLAQRRAAVFDYTALQLNGADVRRLAGEAYGIALSNERAEQLTAHLGGWVTGIVLSLDNVSVEQQPDASARAGVGIEPASVAFERHQLALDLTSLAGAAPAVEARRDVLVEADTAQVYAYFAEQIIEPLGPELRAFLEDTSVLEDLSPRRCDLLRQRDDSARMLDDVKRHGLFVSSRAGWLAYHSLFRDFLRARLARDRQRERAMLRRAGDLYRDEEQLERALDCYLAADSPADAVELLRSAVPRFRQGSRQATLLACFERMQGLGFRERELAENQAEPLIPQAQLLPPDLLLAQARVYSDLSLWEPAYLAIQLAEASGVPVEQQEARILRADLLALQGERQGAREALEELEIAALPPQLQLPYHVTAGRVRIVCGELPAAIAALEQAQALASESGDDTSSLADISDNLGWAYAMQGDRAAALKHLKRADACWQANGNSGRRALTLNNLGTLAMEDGRTVEARAAFEAGLVIARQTARRREETILRCSMAELDILEGELEQALARFTETHAQAVRMDLPASIEAAAAGALWAAALQGDAAIGRAWLDVAEGFVAPGQPEIRGRLALGRALLERMQKRPDQALVAALAAEATAHEAFLSGAERTALALLRASLTFERAGWPRAGAEWEAFVARSHDLPDTLLVKLAGAHRGLVEGAAAAEAPLAQRLIEALRRPDPSRWRVMALGGFSCLVDGEACDLSPLHRALLVRLLDAGPQGLSVERLWESVWGDDAISMPALHQALRRLRVQTGLAVAARDGACVIRSAWEAIEYDVRAFERALEPPVSREALQRAAELYRGDFLPGAPLSAALWADARRAHLQQRYCDALEQLARSAERDQPQLAIHYYQQVMQIDACREHTAAELMRLAARSGNRSLVTATFEHLKGALRALGATPEPATAQLYQQLH